MNINEMNINEKLRDFNEWFDSFILEAIKPLSILSMGLGTIAVFNLQGLAIDPRFVISWAIVQALSMDGLFFATWDRLFTSKRSWAMAGLAFVGIVLALVAIAINAILGFQVLWAIADSQVAMSRLGISSELFTIVRAILAVTVFVMVSFVRSRARATTEPTVATVEKTVKPKRSKTQVSIEPVPVLPEHAASTIESNEQVQGLTSGYKERIKIVLTRYKEAGIDYTYKDIAQEVGASLQTVKLYAPKIKKELEVQE